ncbi:MAG: TRAP transporter substrate-binding protein DctP [Acidimicrobiia bacterium]
MRRTTQLSFWALFMAIVLAACTSATAGTKAGGTPAPITLKIGTDDYPGKPASDQIEEFARQVAELSGGSIVIEPVWHAAGDGGDWDQRVARLVISGDLDMANIPTRAWDTEGVTSLRALNAPFLITNDELVAEVINGDLAAELMSGLEDIGVKGLTLLPEGLRHPFGFDEPLMGPGDYAGKTIRTPTSATTKAVFAALGATVTDEEPDFATQDGWESAYILQPEGVATGNVVFYPKVNSIVINAATFDELSSEQRAILEQAAAGTRSWATDVLPGDAAASAAFCAADQAVVLASDADVTALEQATASVYDELEADPLTKDLIAKIRDLKVVGDSPTATATACGDFGASPTAASPTSTVIDGVYRYEVTEEMMTTAGVTDPQVIRENVGTWTWTFDRGEVGFEQTGPYPESAASDHADHFEIDGDILKIVWPAGDTEIWKWQTNGHGDLILTLVDPGLASQENMLKAHSSVPMTRIDDMGETALPNGIYRAEVHLSDVTAAGYNNDNGVTGTWTIIMKDGTYQLTCEILEDQSQDCGHSGGIDDILEAGYARPSGNTVAFVYDSDLHSQLTGCALPCSPLPTLEVTWSLRGKDLILADLADGDRQMMGSEKVLAPWIWIRDVSS